MSEQKTVVQVINTFSKPVYAQLELAESISSGSVLAAVTASHDLLTNLIKAIDEQYNDELDEQDSLLESLAEKEKIIANNDSLNGLLTMARDEAIAKAVEAEQKSAEGLTLIKEMQATIDNLNARIKLVAQDSERAMRDMTKELKRLKELDPDRLKSQLAEKKKELAQKQQDNGTIRAELNKARSDNATLKSKNAAMVEAAADLTKEVERLTTALSRMNGNVCPEYFESHNGVDVFYLNIFSWGLDSRAMNPDATLLTGMDFHLEIRTNSGINMLVNIDQFGAPVFPHIEHFAKIWPIGLTEYIQDKIIDLLQPTHPLISDRYEWANGVDIADLPIETKHQDALVAAGMHNLFDVVHRTPEEMELRVSGFGMATARKVRAKCLDIVKDWEKAYKREEKAA